MELLVDMNLSLRWVTLLADTGIEVLHWSEVGAANAPDSKIMAFAKNKRHFNPRTYGLLKVTLFRRMSHAEAENEAD